MWWHAEATQMLIATYYLFTDGSAGEPVTGAGAGHIVPAHSLIRDERVD